jgi:hypothetical protein
LQSRSRGDKPDFDDRKQLIDAFDCLGRDQRIGEADEINGLLPQERLRVRPP